MKKVIEVHAKEFRLCQFVMAVNYYFLNLFGKKWPQIQRGFQVLREKEVRDGDVLIEIHYAIRPVGWETLMYLTFSVSPDHKHFYDFCTHGSEEIHPNLQNERFQAQICESRVRIGNDEYILTGEGLDESLGKIIPQRFAYLEICQL